MTTGLSVQLWPGAQWALGNVILLGGLWPARGTCMRGEVAQSYPLYSQVQQRPWQIREHPMEDRVITLPKEYCELAHGRNCLSFFFFF